MSGPWSPPWSEKLVNRRDYHGDVPTAETYQLRHEYGGHVYEGDVKLVRTGMPVYGLWVWLPARREQWEADTRREVAEAKKRLHERLAFFLPRLR